MSTNQCKYDELLMVMKTFLNTKNLVELHCKKCNQKYNWDVMVGTGFNINNLVLSCIAASTVELKPTAIRDGLR